MMSFERARELLGRFSGKRILVVGDLMLDRYVVGSVSRISPEAPVPVVLVTHEYSRPGGAANVALNIQSLGGQAVVAGVVGTDAAGDELKRLLETAGIDTAGVMTMQGPQTTVKTRIVAGRQQVVRVDREESRDKVEGRMNGFDGLLQSLLPNVSSVIVEDYSKGVVSQGVVDRVMTGCRAAGVAVSLDPKDNQSLRIEGLRLATPNYREARLAAGLTTKIQDDDPVAQGELARIGHILQQKWSPELLIVTLGAHGMYLLSRSGEPEMIPTRAREVFDVSGAGDTVIGTATLALAAGATDIEAASLANYAAGVVVGKLGTATCLPHELLECMEWNLRGKGA